MSSTGGGVIVVRHNAVKISGSKAELQEIADATSVDLPQFSKAIQQAINESSDD